MTGSIEIICWEIHEMLPDCFFFIYSRFFWNLHHQNVSNIIKRYINHLCDCNLFWNSDEVDLSQSVVSFSKLWTRLQSFVRWEMRNIHKFQNIRKTFRTLFKSAARDYFAKKIEIKIFSWHKFCLIDSANQNDLPKPIVSNIFWILKWRSHAVDEREWWFRERWLHYTVDKIKALFAQIRKSEE